MIRLFLLCVSGKCNGSFSDINSHYAEAFTFEYSPVIKERAVHADTCHSCYFIKRQGFCTETAIVEIIDQLFKIRHFLLLSPFWLIFLNYTTFCCICQYHVSL